MDKHLPTPYCFESSGKRLPLPDLPKSQWCDFRQDYETGMTLKSISEKYLCDPRTVKRCLILNKRSTDLGRQTAPTVLAPYMTMIQALWSKYDQHTGICRRSRDITVHLREADYKGSERTVRNYLRTHYYIVNSHTSPEGCTQSKLNVHETTLCSLHS